jgi:microcystin-dependent protein
MADPQTPNLGAYVPTVGSDVGTWYQPLNANASVQDSLSANVATIPLSSGNVTLTTPPNSGAAWAGPYQSQSAVLRLTGALVGNAGVIFPRAGFWIVENNCTGAFVVFLFTGGGQIICAPPGEACHVYCDGTNLKYVNMGRVGSYIDMMTTAVPAWITNCTVAPYLNCDGSAFSGVTYPALAAFLGGTTLPDSRGRARMALNQGTGRVTAGGSGVDGNTVAAAGGNEFYQQHSHTITDPGHFHIPGAGSNFAVGVSGGELGQLVNSGNGIKISETGATDTRATGIPAATGLSGAGASQNVQPTFVGGLTLIKT